MKLALKLIDIVVKEATEDDPFEIVKQAFVPFSAEDKSKMILLKQNSIYEIDIKNMDMRTVQQNKAIHLFASLIAKELNSKNIHMKGIFNQDIEWTMELVKTQIIKTTIKKVYDLNSTTKLTRKQVDGMIDYIVNAFVGTIVEVPEFPNKEYFDKKDMK